MQATAFFAALQSRCYYKAVFGVRRGQLREHTEKLMARYRDCGGYLIYEPEVAKTAARVKCVACGWMRSDPNFRKEEPTYFPPDRIDKQIEWTMQNSGFDLYDSGSAAAQLGISESFFRESVRKDPKAPVITGRGMIACNTPTLQQWWDGKRHHRVIREG